MKLVVTIIKSEDTSADWLGYNAHVAGMQVAVGSGNVYKILATVKAFCDSPQYTSVEVEFNGFNSRVDENHIHFLLTGKARA